MKYFQNPQGEVYAYEQSDIDAVNNIAALETALQAAQRHLSSLSAPGDAPEEGDDPHTAEREAYEAAQRDVSDAQDQLDAVLPVFFSIREKLKTLTEMTPAEIDAHLNPPVDPEQVAADVRAQRDVLLRESDWVTTRAYDMQEPVPQEWAEYRQALRDVPEQAGFPEDIDWPQVPANPTS